MAQRERAYLDSSREGLGCASVVEGLLESRWPRLHSCLMPLGHEHIFQKQETEGKHVGTGLSSSSQEAEMGLTRS